MIKKTEEYGSVQKALDILKAFAPEGRPMGTLEISRKLDIHKSTVSRLVGVLCQHGFLIHDANSRKYILGCAINELYTASKSSLTEILSSIAQPYMNRLRDKFNESVGLETLINNEIMVIAEALSTSFVRVGFLLQQKVPLNAAAGAKAILAYSDPNVTDRMMQGEYIQHTQHSITEPAIYKKQLQQIRKSGISFDHGEFNDDINALAAPIFAADGSPIAGIVICMLDHKMDNLLKKGLVEEMKETAASITAELINTI